MHLSIRDVRFGKRSQRGLAWLVLGLVAQLAACSSTSSSDAGLDAPKSADALPASADSPLAKDGPSADRTVPDAAGTDVPWAPDTATPDAPLARGDGASDTQVIADAPGSLLDLAQDRALPDTKALQDAAAVPDSSSTKDVRTVETQGTPEATDARPEIVPLRDPGKAVWDTERAGTGVCAGAPSLLTESVVLPSKTTWYGISAEPSHRSLP